MAKPGRAPTFTAREQVMLRPDDAELIRAAADEHDMSVSALIREAVKHYIPRLEKKNELH